MTKISLHFFSSIEKQSFDLKEFHKISTSWRLKAKRSSKRPFFQATSGPNMRDQREAYQSSTVGLFSCFWTTSWKIVKIITYMVIADFFCNWKVIITSGTTKFEKEKRKFLHPLPPKNGLVCAKITKSYVFPTLDLK